eukprot:1142841-Pelagomonas_calceolata.AAC.9
MEFPKVCPAQKLQDSSFKHSSYTTAAPPTLPYSHQAVEDGTPPHFRAQLVHRQQLRKRPCLCARHRPLVGCGQPVVKVTHPDHCLSIC